MSVELSLRREFDIRFIDARNITNEAKVELGIQGYPSQDQIEEVRKEAFRIFYEQSETSKQNMKRLRESLEAVTRRIDTEDVMFSRQDSRGGGSSSSSSILSLCHINSKRHSTTATSLYDSECGGGSGSLLDDIESNPTNNKPFLSNSQRTTRSLPSSLLQDRKSIWQLGRK